LAGSGSIVHQSNGGTEVDLVLGGSVGADNVIFDYFLQSIQYENTSSTPPSSVQIRFDFGALPTIFTSNDHIGDLSSTPPPSPVVQGNESRLTP
jgi:hypothetical protein